MRPLYEITSDLALLNNRLEELEGDLSLLGDEQEKIVSDFLDQLGAEQRVKLDGYIFLIKQLQMEEVAAKAEAEQWLHKHKNRKARWEFLKAKLKGHMEVTKQTEIITARGVKLSIVGNGGVMPVDTDEILPDDVEKRVPEEFHKKTITIDNAKVRAALDAGRQLTFARFRARGTNLRIK